MASTDATPIPVKNQAYRVTFPILDADGDLVTAAGSLDSEVSKDGGTFADCTNEATEVATSSGMYFLDLTATEMNADTVAIIVKSTSGKTTPIVLYPQAGGDDIDVNVTHWNGTAVATPTTAGVPKVEASDTHSRLVVVEASIDSDQTSRTTAISDVKSRLVVVESAIDSDQTSRTTALANIDSQVTATDSQLTVTDGVADQTYSRLQVVETAIDSDQTSRVTKLNTIGSDVLQVYSDTTILTGESTSILSSVQAAESQVVIVLSDTTALETAVIMASGTADSGSTTTMVDAARTEADTDYWAGNRILFTSGTIAGQVREITAFTPGTDTITFSPATTQAVGTNTYDIIQGIAASGLSAGQDSKLTQVHSDTLAADIVSMSSSVEAIEAGGGSLTAAQDSKLTQVHSESAVIEAKTSDTHSRLVFVEAAIDSDQTSRATVLTAIDSQATATDSQLTVTDAVVDQAYSRLQVVETAIDSDQTSRATALTNIDSQVTATDSQLTVTDTVADQVYSRLQVVETAIDSDQVVNDGALTNIDSQVTATDSQLTVTDAAVDQVYSRLQIVETAIDSDQTSRTAAISDVKSALTLVQADLPVRLTKNTAFSNFMFKMVDATDGFTAETGLTPTCQRSLDGAAFGACANAPTEVANGWYKINLNATDLNGDVVVLRFSDATSRDTEFHVIMQAT